MKKQRITYVAPLLYVTMLEESRPLCGSLNKQAGTIGGNGTQTGESITYGGEDTGEGISVDSKSNDFSTWDEWE